MAWLDYWLLVPWVLYDGTALRVLVAGTAAIVVMAFLAARYAGVKSPTGSS